MSSPPRSAGLTGFVRFAALGALGTGAHYAVLVALVEWGGADPLLGSVAGFIVGGLVNYALARRLVFGSQRAHVEALPRFLAVACVGALGNGLLMQLLHHWLGVHYLAAQLATTALLVVWHYLANALWTFGRGAGAAAER